ERHTDDWTLRNDKPFTVDRREVVQGIIAGAVVVSTPAVAEQKASHRRPEVQIIRNPERHDEFGIGIDFIREVDGVDSPISIALYPRTFGSNQLPEGWRLDPESGKYIESIQNLDRFDFTRVSFSNRGRYALRFQLEHMDGIWNISATFNRLGQT